MEITKIKVTDSSFIHRHDYKKLMSIKDFRIDFVFNKIDEENYNIGLIINVIQENDIISIIPSVHVYRITDINTNATEEQFQQLAYDIISSSKVVYKKEIGVAIPDHLFGQVPYDKILCLLQKHFPPI